MCQCQHANCGNLSDWPCDFWHSTFLTDVECHQAAAAMRRQVQWTRERLAEGYLHWTDYREREIASRERQAEFWETVLAQRAL